MKLSISEEPATSLAEYARVSIGFEVSRVLDVTVRDGGLGGLSLVERTLTSPYVKDYDAIEGESPADWASRFDLSNWAFFAAHLGTRRVGGAVVAFDTPELFMLEGRRDLAVVWDLRVSPDSRAQGIGEALFGRVEAWAIEKGCRQLKVETQNINVAACRFYARRGCVLGGINRFAYAALPDEVQLLWYKDLYHDGSR